MHPNCRCTITAYPAELFPENIDWDKLKEIWESLPGRIETPLDNIADAAYDIWKFFFDQSLQEFIGIHGTIGVDGTEYRINKNTFQAVSIGPDGEFIDPDNVSEKDRQMLELMKRRDSLPAGSEERASIVAQLEEIYRRIPKPERNVNPSNPYDYYILEKWYLKCTLITIRKQ